MKMSEALTNIAVLAIDTSPFIYYIERYPEYVEKVRAIFLQARQNQTKIKTSTITLTEVLSKPLSVDNQGLLDAYRDMLKSTRNISLISVDGDVAEIGAMLRARYNLKTPDALQIACAISANCNAFLTNDHALSRVSEIPILLLDEIELA